MSVQITTAFVQKYKAGIEIGLQQKGSVLADKVRNESQSAKFDFYDKINATAAQKVTERHGNTPLVDTQHARRRCGLVDYDWADLIDKADKLRLLEDPTGPYTMNAVMALGRSKDDEIIAGAFASVATGETGATPVAMPTSTDTNVVAVNYVESGAAANSGLTIAKLRRAKYFLDRYQNDPSEERFIALGAKQVMDLLRTTEVTSADYNTVRALVEGKIDTFMGFKFVQTERLLVDGSSYRRLLCWVKSGLLLATAQEVEVDIAPRKDKRNATQVYVCGSFGSIRMDEGKVVEILASEA